MNIARHILFSGALLLACASLQAQGLDQNLVARWTFKDGSLTSDNGEYTFSEGGRGTAEAANGSITLRDNKYLIVPDFTSEKFPDLKRNVTLWARLKFEELPAENEANVMSLQAGQKSGDWADMILSLLYRAAGPQIPNAGFAFLGRAANDWEMGVGASRMLPATAGEFMNVAIVFDGAAGTASMWVNGVYATSAKAEVAELKDFGAFGIGQLKAPGTPIAITFDEVRIYSVALDPQWLEEITPTE